MDVVSTGMSQELPESQRQQICNIRTILRLSMCGCVALAMYSVQAALAALAMLVLLLVGWSIAFKH